MAIAKPQGLEVLEGEAAFPKDKVGDKGKSYLEVIYENVVKYVDMYNDEELKGLEDVAYALRMSLNDKHCLEKHDPVGWWNCWIVKENGKGCISDLNGKIYNNYYISLKYAGLIFKIWVHSGNKS